ncbi:YggS family pyridoxal phosphate-dependent enzyme [Alphaproteobacteria bacterium]|nr:YggS family pyridoxal phosphate-dependent enzyme [Alphaproteobacteria bacterium]
MTINNLNLQKIKSDLIGSNAKLLIVTKNQDIGDIQTLYDTGHRLFGENKVQEAKKKFSNFDPHKIELHLIGPLQTNKVKDALKTFDTIQSIDREKLVEEIIKELKTNKPYKTKEFFIQINIGNENQKSGISKTNIKDFFNLCVFKGLNIRGLMCIPPLEEDPDLYFEEMQKIREDINPNLLLSMGMSNDYQIALKYQTNIIRIGSKIFEKNI